MSLVPGKWIFLCLAMSSMADLLWTHKLLQQLFYTTSKSHICTLALQKVACVCPERFPLLYIQLQRSSNICLGGKQNIPSPGPRKPIPTQADSSSPKANKKVMAMMEERFNCSLANVFRLCTSGINLDFWAMTSNYHSLSHFRNIWVWSSVWKKTTTCQWLAEKCQFILYLAFRSLCSQPLSQGNPAYDEILGKKTRI